MTLFEEKVNEYRENKRLLEELEAMNELQALQRGIRGCKL